MDRRSIPDRPAPKVAAEAISLVPTVRRSHPVREAASTRRKPMGHKLGATASSRTRAGTPGRPIFTLDTVRQCPPRRARRQTRSHSVGHSCPRDHQPSDLVRTGRGWCSGALLSVGACHCWPLLVGAGHRNIPAPGLSFSAVADPSVAEVRFCGAVAAGDRSHGDG
jgi:hypothetical protein